MHIFKKTAFIASLVLLSTAARADEEPANNNNFKQIVPIFQLALQDVFDRINNKIRDGIDATHAHQLFLDERDAITTKFAHAFKHNLNPEQQAIMFEIVNTTHQVSQTPVFSLLSSNQLSPDQAVLQFNKIMSSTERLHDIIVKVVVDHQNQFETSRSGISAYACLVFVMMITMPSPTSCDDDDAKLSAVLAFINTITGDVLEAINQK